MSLRAWATKSAWASDFGTSRIKAAGDGSGLVSTTLMSDVLCMEPREEARIAARRKGVWCRRPGDLDPLGQKSGGPPTPRRPAFAFLVTPKLPLGGRSEKF